MAAHPDEKEHQRLWREARKFTPPLLAVHGEILEFEPQSFADLAVQFEQFTRLYEGSEIEQLGWAFLVRAADNISRLVGRVS